MKKIFTLLIVSILGGVLTLGSYKLLFEKNFPHPKEQSITETKPDYFPVSNNPNIYGTNVDFTEAAEKTVHAVVNVKNVAIFDKPGSIWEYYYRGESSGKILQGVGSGVIISPDGYIVTNNHVITGASEIEVTLNNNKNYKAEIIGSDLKSDIALLKIDARDLKYLSFGNSNNIKLGEWVLAVGNPFNLTSTVTAGIVSAKARDLSITDSSPQSFIQTDAAINPGNSGGALVNVNAELIGINSAITSRTGSFIGYSFAVPSNIVRKIVEDIMEYGTVQQGILGIRGSDINSAIAKQLNLDISQGVYHRTQSDDICQFDANHAFFEISPEHTFCGRIHFKHAPGMIKHQYSVIHIRDHQTINRLLHHQFISTQCRELLLADKITRETIHHIHNSKIGCAK